MPELSNFTHMTQDQMKNQNYVVREIDFIIQIPNPTKLVLSSDGFFMNSIKLKMKEENFLMSCETWCQTQQRHHSEM